MMHTKWDSAKNTGSIVHTIWTDAPVWEIVESGE